MSTHSNWEQLGDRSILNVGSSSTPFQIRRRVTEGWRRGGEGGIEGRRRRVGRWHARALSFTLSSGSHPPDFPDRKKNDEWRRGRKNGEKENASGFTSRELPGKGGQPEPRRYNDWLAEANSPSAALVVAPTNSPLSLRVSVWSVNTRARAHTRTLRQAVHGSRAFKRKGGYIWRILPCGCRR